jgi:putative flippase GtrA
MSSTRKAEVRRLFAFFVVGGINMLVGYALFAAFILVGLGTTLALLCATVIGVLFNYRTTGKLVFRSDRAVFRLFIIVYIAQFATNWLALKALAAAGVGPLPAQLIVLLPLAVATYAAMRSWVFNGGPRT